MIHINQELCSGCGICVDICPYSAIHLVEQQAVITDDLCTQCEVCIDACKNGAIETIAEPTRILPIVTLPSTESGMVPGIPLIKPLETAPPTSSLASFTGAALTFLGTEVAPRLVNILINALERKVEQPKTITVSLLSTPSRVLGTQGSSRQRQTRYRGGRTGIGNQKGRR